MDTDKKLHHMADALAGVAAGAAGMAALAQAEAKAQAAAHVAAEKAKAEGNLAALAAAVAELCAPPAKSPVAGQSVWEFLAAAPAQNPLADFFAPYTEQYTAKDAPAKAPAGSWMSWDDGNKSMPKVPSAPPGPYDAPAAWAKAALAAKESLVAEEMGALAAAWAKESLAAKEAKEAKEALAAPKGPPPAPKRTYGTPCEACGVSVSVTECVVHDPAELQSFAHDPDVDGEVVLGAPHPKVAGVPFILHRMAVVPQHEYDALAALRAVVQMRKGEVHAKIGAHHFGSVDSVALANHLHSTPGLHDSPFGVRLLEIIHLLDDLGL